VLLFASLTLHNEQPGRERDSPANGMAPPPVAGWLAVGPSKRLFVQAKPSMNVMVSYNIIG